MNEMFTMVDSKDSENGRGMSIYTQILGFFLLQSGAYYLYNSGKLSKSFLNSIV